MIKVFDFYFDDMVEATGYPFERLSSDTKEQVFVYMRFIIWDIMHKAGYSQSEIARLFNRKPCTVNIGLKRYTNDLMFGNQNLILTKDRFERNLRHILSKRKTEEVCSQ